MSSSSEISYKNMFGRCFHFMFVSNNPFRVNKSKKTAKTVVFWDELFARSSYTHDRFQNFHPDVFYYCISSQNNFLTLWSQKHGKKEQNGRGVLRDEFLHISFNSEYDSKHFSFLSLGPKMRSFWYLMGGTFSDARGYLFRRWSTEVSWGTDMDMSVNSKPFFTMDQAN